MVVSENLSLGEPRFSWKVSAMVEMEWWVVIIMVYSLESQVRKIYHCDCGDKRGLLWWVLITKMIQGL